MKKILKPIVVCMFFMVLFGGCNYNKVPIELKQTEEFVKSESSEIIQENVSKEYVKEKESFGGKEYDIKEAQTEALEGWEEEASKAARVCESWFDFEYEAELPYADGATVEALKAAYDKIDFHGTFEVGNTEVYEDYKEKYRKLVNEEVPFWNKAGSEAFYLSEYGVFAQYPEAEYLYYFFDVDGDSVPELGIFKNAGFSCCIFDYDAEEDRFYLWHELGSTWNRIGGTRKVFWERLGAYYLYRFCQLDEKGETEIESFFFSYNISETETLNIIEIPEYMDGSSQMKLTDEMKSQGIFTTNSGSWYFRVSDEDFEELENRYMEAFEEAGKQREEVTYTYEELFGAEQ